MRSTSSHRRLHASPSRPRPIDALARVIDEGTIDEPGHLLVHVVDEGDDAVLGVRPLEPDVHPFTELAGCTAPREWTMVGLRVRGTAHHLEGADPPRRTSTTYLLGRDGAESSVLRADDSVQVLGGPAVGTLPDVCRRLRIFVALIAVHSAGPGGRLRVSIAPERVRGRRNPRPRWATVGRPKKGATPDGNNDGKEEERTRSCTCVFGFWSRLRFSWRPPRGRTIFPTMASL